MRSLARSLAIAAMWLATASLTLCAAEVATNAAAPVSSPEVSANLFKGIMSAISDKVDIGGTYTVRLEKNLDHAASLSLFGKMHTWQASARWELAAGLAYSYVPAWDEHYTGVGMTATLFDTPAPVLAARDSLPVVSTILPRMTKIKAFAAIECRLANFTPALTIGLTVPF